MNRESRPGKKPPARFLTPLLILLAAAGGAAFRVAVARNTELAWKVFLVNFLFWSGVSIAGLVFSAVLELVHASWAGPVRRVAESFSGFFPVSLLLYLVLLQGARSLYPWIAHPPPGRAAWFNFSFFVIRDTAAILALYGIGFAFLNASMRRRRRGIEPAAGASVLAVLFVIAYAFAFSLLCIDLVMSLSPDWTSTLFPAYFFMGNLYAGIAVVVAACFLWRRFGGERGWLDDAHAHDLGKVLLGFSMLWTYLFWSQYLVIWYGNLPEEFQFVALRTRGAWESVSWLVLLLCSAVPFAALLTRSTKRPAPLFVIALAPICGVWLERFLLVAPSAKLVPTFGGLELAVTLGFGALFVLAQRTALSLTGGSEPVS